MNVLKAEDSEHKEIFMWTPSRESIIWVCDINHPAYTAQTPEMLLFLILRSTQSDCPHLQSSRNFTLIILVSISFYQDRLFSKICPYFQCFNCPFTETHTHTPHTHTCVHTHYSVVVNEKQKIMISYRVIISRGPDTKHTIWLCLGCVDLV